MNLQNHFKNFYNQYPYLSFDKLIDYFFLFGGSEKFLDIYYLKDIENILTNFNIKKILEKFPFFILEKPFKDILIKIALSDSKVESIFRKTKTSIAFREDILEELIRNNILYIEYSRETPLKKYPKQQIKKEYKNYTIQNKLRFTIPFYHLFFAFIAPYIKKDLTLNKEQVVNSFKRDSNKIKSLWFEHLSKELIKYKFNNVSQCYSYWDKFSEFDIYCKISNKYLIGECKYTNKPITKAELLKLKSKIEKSKLNNHYLALFSKSGFSKELEKIQEENLYLFSLKDFKELL